MLQTTQVNPVSGPANVPNLQNSILQRSDVCEQSIIQSQTSTKANTPKSTKWDFAEQADCEIAALRALLPAARKKNEEKYIKKYIRQCRNVFLVDAAWSEFYTEYLKND